MFCFRFHYDLYLFFKMLDLSKSSKSSLGLCHRPKGHYFDYNYRFLFVETGSLGVDQAGLELTYPPTPASSSIGIEGLQHYA